MPMARIRNGYQVLGVSRGPSFLLRARTPAFYAERRLRLSDDLVVHAAVLD